jgi:hypothetical protein
MTYRETITVLEDQIEKLKDQRINLSRMFGINDVEVGQQILEKKEIIKKESLMNK